jgi:phosphonate transport system ATP-binding protein
MRVQLQQVQVHHPSAKVGATPVLRGISVDIAAGEQVVVIGPSGAGKTTFLQTIAAALKPQAGHLKLGDQDPWSLSVSALQALRGRLFLAPQTPPLPPRQRVVTSVLAGRLAEQSFFSSLRSLFYPTNVPLAYNALLEFDLGEKLWERVDRLSGGERQRVSLARALVSNTSLWLVDEPLSALDPTRATQAIKSLSAQARARNATLIASLHQVSIALQEFTRVIALREGVVVFDLPASQVTQAMLSELYANFEHELSASAQPVDSSAEAPATTPLPAVMHCR